MPELLEDDVRATAPRRATSSCSGASSAPDSTAGAPRAARRGGVPKPRKPRRELALWKPAAALAFTALFALVVVSSVLTGGVDHASDDAGTAGGGSASESVAREAGPPRPRRRARTIRAAPWRRPGAPRVVQRSAELGLAAPPDEFDEVRRPACWTSPTRAARSSSARTSPSATAAGSRPTTCACPPRAWTRRSPSSRTSRRSRRAARRATTSPAPTSRPRTACATPAPSAGRCCGRSNAPTPPPSARTSGAA